MLYCRILYLKPIKTEEAHIEVVLWLLSDKTLYSGCKKCDCVSIAATTQTIFKHLYRTWVCFLGCFLNTGLHFFLYLGGKSSFLCTWKMSVLEYFFSPPTLFPSCHPSILLLVPSFPFWAPGIPISNLNLSSAHIKAMEERSTLFCIPVILSPAPFPLLLLPTPPSPLVNRYITFSC